MKPIQKVVLVGLLASLVAGCGSEPTCRSFNLPTGASADAGAETVCTATLGNEPVVRPEGSGAAGAPVVTCHGKDGAYVDTREYGCGRCEDDMSYPVVCIHNRLACPTAYISGQGSVVTVSEGTYVLGGDDQLFHSGQCAYLKSLHLPGFAIQPMGLTHHDPVTPILLRAVSATPRNPASFSGFFLDPAKGEQAIHALVAITDRADGSPVPYTLGTPKLDAVGMQSTLELFPTSPLAPDRGYRVTLLPGNQQSFVECNTFGVDGAVLTAPETTEFYTYSRPMVSSMFIAYKSGTSGYLAFTFSEPLADLDAYDSATVFIDGVPFPGCMLPYACSGSATSQVDQLRLDTATLPVEFSMITLRIPHAVKSVYGGTILDGTKDNPYVTVEGAQAVYTFNTADFVSSGSGLRTWTYRAP